MPEKPMARKRTNSDRKEAGARPVPREENDAKDRTGGQPAEEWGQRQQTGKTIQRGGKTKGDVPGATPDRS
jgi:hypothetical protein